MLNGYVEIVNSFYVLQIGLTQRLCIIGGKPELSIIVFKGGRIEAQETVANLLETCEETQWL